MIDRFLEMYSAEIAWGIIVLLCVWIVILERKRQRLQEELKRAENSAETFRVLAEAWGDALQEKRGQPNVIPCATMVRKSGDNVVVLVEWCLN